MVAAACPESNFPQLEMGEERIPLLGGDIAVLLAGPLGPAAGDERPMVRDHIFRVDRRVTHRCVHGRMPADLGSDVRWKSGADGIGDEDSPEVVGAPLQRLAGGGDPGSLRRGDKALPDVAAGDGPVLGAETPLEQQRLDPRRAIGVGWAWQARRGSRTRAS